MLVRFQLPGVEPAEGSAGRGAASFLVLSWLHMMVVGYACIGARHGPFNFILTLPRPQVIGEKSDSMLFDACVFYNESSR